MFHTYNSILFSYSVRAQRYPENRPLGLFKYLGSFLPKFVGAQYAYKIMAQKLGEARAQLALQVASSLSCLKKVHGNSRNYLLNSSCQSLENKSYLSIIVFHNLKPSLLTVKDLFGILFHMYLYVIHLQH